MHYLRVAICRRGWTLYLLPMFAMLFLASGRTLAVAQDATHPASGFVGSETCATCHEDVAKKLGDNPHSRIEAMHGKAGASCESCHGPGKAHVDGGGDVTKIINPAKANPKQISETCLTCHAGAHPNFQQSNHAKAGVSCVSCHSVHAAKVEKSLLKAQQPDLCFTCHADQKASFNQLFHHKTQEGLIKCSDCHDSHGTFEDKQLRTTADKNAVCTKCHTETRGPFVFEHVPVKAEGCMACHTPHGSQNARLLNVPNVNQLCNQCHSAVAAGTVHGQGAGSSDQPPCIGCHNFIHGSNINPAFIR
ncbi:decaheme c-type cytochrome, DmsE family [Bryocella elongata]|uniref:Decaheme c-type cytochrome, DmsE family n=1 Tax=Bryocella elongata TaxID=863522 RepID=A0A1H5VY25_9BACT|nr:decaheme c-type cytochrome, DmsE family [Bryocella elongata]